MTENKKGRRTISITTREPADGHSFGISSNRSSEKVSVNLNTATLSQIDLLVDGGYYSNRSDFINQALRETLDRRKSDIDRLVQQQRGTICDNKYWFMGVYSLERQELEGLRRQGKVIQCSGYGLLNISETIPDELVFATVESIQVRGKVVATDAVKQHYGLK